jgi:acetyltransferase-like isoleucine patch superfamily enzyme
VVFKYPLHAGISLGDRVRIGEYCVLDIPIGARLVVGNDVTLTMGVVLAARDSIDLGANSLVGEYSSLRDSDHGTQPDQLIRKQAMISLPVSVGSDVWLGRGVCVLKGVSIGDCAVVGANAVVVESLPPHTVSVGAPAKVLRVRK